MSKRVDVDLAFMGLALALACLNTNAAASIVFAMAVLNYAHRRHVIAHLPPPLLSPQDPSQELVQLKEDVEKIRIALKLRGIQHE